MAMIDIDWRPEPRELRKFGVVVLVGMGVIGAGFHFFSDAPEVARWLWIAGAVLGLPALTGTAIALPGYWLWMGIAFVMGNIMSRVLLAAIYFLLVTPLGLLRRALGGDPLQLKKPAGETYWRDLSGGSAESGYERQF